VAYFGDLEYVFDKTSPVEAPCPVCDDTQLATCPMCADASVVGSGSGINSNCNSGSGSGSSIDSDSGSGSPAVCSACRGSWKVVCRSYFSGDPLDLQGIRRKVGNTRDES
jgi:hypothetical protein